MIDARPKPSRGQAYETYLTHRICGPFFFKADYIRYNHTWSGSGRHIGVVDLVDARGN